MVRSIAGWGRTLLLPLLPDDGTGSARSDEGRKDEGAAHLHRRMMGVA